MRAFLIASTVAAGLLLVAEAARIIREDLVLLEFVRPW
jgi:hypothetical protein